MEAVFTLKGLPEVLAQVGGVLDEKTRRDILDESAAVMLNRIRTRFLRELDPNGQPWVPSRAGLERRRQGGTGTLFDTGRLFRSIQLFGKTNTSRTIGTDVPYAPKLQTGGWRAFDNPRASPQPPRVFLGFGPEDATVVLAIAERRVLQNVGG